MELIKSVFEKINKRDEKAIIAFIAMGNKSLNESIEIAETIENSGASILALGIPYSDPLADEAVIQDAYQNTLLAGVKFKDCLQAIEKITSKINIPVIVSAYYNLIYCKGVRCFIEEMQSVNVRGIIVPDISLEERSELLNECKEHDIALIPIVATTSKERIAKITEGSDTFVNCLYQFNKEENQIRDYEDYLKEVRSYTKIPICIEFDDLQRNNIHKAREYYNGIVIKSEIVKIMNSKKSFSIRAKEVADLISNLKSV